MFVQVRAELWYRPNSWLSQQIIKWYDALYRASETIDLYSIPQAPVLTNNAQKQSYIWQIIQTMTIADATNMLQVLTKDNKDRKK